MSIDTTYRIDSAEIMDDFSMEGEELRDALDKIAGINRFLGGNSVTIDGVEKLLHHLPKETEITIVDLGCGNGDMLRILADHAAENGHLFRLVGIDANSFTVNYARQLSAEYSNISYRCADIFKESTDDIRIDIALATLTLHHFKDDEILALIKRLEKEARIGIVINDLHRSRTAYRLFKAICFIFGLNRMSREDGLVSILRGFKKRELQRFSEILHLKNYTIRWKWAFRYQWIISNI
jgi:SAM-dependent methyltransferase